MTQYLPIHPDMLSNLYIGLQVINNSGRQGREAGVTWITSDYITVYYPELGKEVSYLRKWFVDNFWIQTDGINEIGKRTSFNGKGYLVKYRKYAKSKEEMQSKQYLCHAAMKLNKESEENIVNHDLFYSEQNTQSQDEVGVFLVYTVDGSSAPTVHKTFRIAKLIAEENTSRDGKERLVMETACTVRAKQVVTYKVESTLKRK